MTVFSPRGQAVILHAPPIARPPLDLAMRAEPLRGNDGQSVEGMTPCFPDALEARDGTHARQYRRGVGALASAGFEPLALAAALQDGVEQALFGGPDDQAGAELAEDRAVEAGVGERSTEGIRPRDPAAHGLGRLAI